MSQVNQYAEQIAASLSQMVELARDLPEKKVRWKPSSEEWSIMETLCHVEEATNYWLDELQRVVANPGEWGRGLNDAKRLQAVAEADRRKIADVISGVQKAQNRVKEVFAGLKDDQLNIEASHRNPKFGVKPMRFLVEHFLVEHMEIHVNQIKRIMRQYEERQC